MTRNKFLLKMARLYKNWLSFYYDNSYNATVGKNLLYLGIFAFIFAVLIGVIYFDIAIIANFKSNLSFYTQGIISEYNSNYVGRFFLIGFGKIISLMLSLYLIFILSSTVESIYELLIYKLILFKKSYKSYYLESVLYKALKWCFYRLYLVFAPSLGIGIGLACLIIGGYVFFNQIAKIASISLGMTTFMLVFAGLSLFISFFISLPFAIWNFIKSEYGLECVITEPHLKNKKILRRSAHFVVSNPMNYIFLSLNYIFVGFLIFQFWYLTHNQSIMSIATLHKLCPMIFSNITAWCILKFLKMNLYVETLKTHYENITFNINDNQGFLSELNTNNAE